MTGIKEALKFFSTDESEKQIIANKIVFENIRRVFYLSIIAVPVSLVHILLFGFSLKTSAGTEHVWRLGIFLSHLAIFGVLSIIGFLIYFYSIRTKQKSTVAKISVHIVIVLLLFGGSVITTIDQLVTSAINPYIVTCLVTAIVLLVRPLYAVFYYSASYLVYYFLIGLTQLNPDVLISNRVNGITITGIGLCLSFVFWRMNMVRINQNILIKQQQQELVRQYDELKESNATKDKLFSVIAHDLKTPFNATLGLTKILAEDIEALSPSELKQLMQTLYRESMLSYQLLNNLLDWSRSQLKRLNPQPRNIDLQKAVSEIVFEVENLSRAKEITLVVECPEKLTVFADPPMVHSILKNLVTNAIKFTPAGGKITIGASVKSNFAEVCVNDDGVGIAKEKLEQLFSKVNTLTTFGTDNEKGTGLGLQICKEFVELNGGKIHVISEVGKGSSFCFTLPPGK